ncbi:thrombospondin type 3 repeat-containing protein [Candidatus Peregrinibacteria bacterium]|nr:thrombospondin type 3 repeat-containing protein [Candidatus Peregrinibacteria bacterium]
MKKCFTLLFIFACLSAFPHLAYAAADGDLSISDNQVRFSTNKFIEGQTLRIYATVTNNSSKDLLGAVKFFDETQNKQIDGDQPVSVFAEKTDDVFTDYKLPAGTIKINVQVIPFQKEIDNPVNNAVVKTIYVEPDLDRDGIPDKIDPDWDNDGVPNAEDAFPKNYKESIDTDGDGIGNNADLDDDNDGAQDTADAFPTNPKESIDTDKDGIGNNADTDDDGDGISDADEQKLGTDPLKADTDGDGVIDGKDAFPLDPKESLDTDKDGIGNNADTDDDGDGIPDSQDKFPTNLAPIAKISSPDKLEQINKQIIFDASKSIDKDGSVAKIAWTINDSIRLDENSPIYTFKNAGKYKIALAITDNAGETTTTEKTVYAANYKSYIKIILIIALIALALWFGLQYTKGLKKPTITHKKPKK